MTATIILSFDCEGKWGVADHLDVSHDTLLSDASLKEAYCHLLTILEAASLSATFAFVGTFTRSPGELRRLPLVELAQELPYLREAARRVAQGDEGWSGAWAVDLLGENHELALHGGTHVPWDDLTETQARGEMSIAPIPGVETFVFPRNKVSYPWLLPEFGIRGYRGCRPPRSRLASLAAEFNIGARPDRHAIPSDPIEIPAGYFINWRQGPRRLVPVAVSLLRLRNLLRQAEEECSVVHFWSHPENFATAPRTFCLFEAMVNEIVRARDAGRARVLTQRAYCAEIATLATH